MPAFNFKKEFADGVESGIKRQTIRKPRKTGNPEPGATLYLFTGMRTRACRRLLTIKCKQVDEIRIAGHGSVFIDGHKLGIWELQKLVKDDGFTSVAAFFAFFQKNYGFPFNGILIKW